MYASNACLVRRGCGLGECQPDMQALSNCYATHVQYMELQNNCRTIAEQMQKKGRGTGLGDKVWGMETEELTPAT